MPATHPRVNVVLDEPTRAFLQGMSRREKTSVSEQVRRLLDEAMELHEDLALAALAAARERTFHPKSSLSHAQVWGRAGR